MLSFIEFRKNQIDELVDFLTSESWPFHGQVNPTEDSVRSSFQKGFYTEDGNQTFWIIDDAVKIGVIRLFDLEDPTCLIDIRFKKSSRGKRLGVAAVNWISQHVFTHFTHIIRVEGHTRNDNFAMRKTFHNSGYVKEAYHRDAWPQGGKLFDSVGYAMTRNDFENKTITYIKDEFLY